MTSLQTLAPIQALQGASGQAVTGVSAGSSGGSMFTQIVQSMVNNVKETDAAKNEAYYALVTGQLDDPAEATIAASQAQTATQLLVQMRDRALDAYSELMRISL